MKKYFKQLKANKKGFTLIEMIVVIAIIGILAAILVPSMAGYLETSRQSRREANARTVYTAAQAAVTSMEATEQLENGVYTKKGTDDAIFKSTSAKSSVLEAEDEESGAGSVNKDPKDRLFDKIIDLIGTSNYDQFQEISVKITNGAVDGVSVLEKGETEPVEYPNEFTLSTQK